MTQTRSSRPQRLADELLLQLNSLAHQLVHLT
jgi:hypothetical protein